VIHSEVRSMINQCRVLSGRKSLYNRQNIPLKRKKIILYRENKNGKLKTEGEQNSK
jgi:hypothetical protein